MTSSAKLYTIIGVRGCFFFLFLFINLFFLFLPQQFLKCSKMENKKYKKIDREICNDYIGRFYLYTIHDWGVGVFFRMLYYRFLMINFILLLLGYLCTLFVAVAFFVALLNVFVCSKNIELFYNFILFIQH